MLKIPSSRRRIAIYTAHLLKRQFTAASSTTTTNGDIQFNNLSELELLPGNYDLVITSFNTYPYESTITVVAPEGAYLIYDDFDVISGSISYGESSTLSLSIENVGIESTSNIEGIITTQDPYVILEDNIVNFDYINAGEISQSNDSFSFSLLNSVPDGHSINFNIYWYNQSNNLMY